MAITVIPHGWESFPKGMADASGNFLKAVQQKKALEQKAQIEQAKLEAKAKEPKSRLDQLIDMAILEKGGVPSSEQVLGNSVPTTEQLGQVDTSFKGMQLPQADIVDSIIKKQTGAVSDPLAQREAAIGAMGKVTEQGALLPGKVEEKKELTKVKWNEEDVDRQIKFDVFTPKMNNYMEVGGRAYQELNDVYKEFSGGEDLDFGVGGFEAIKAKIFKNAAMAAKAAPLMSALEALRPELGVEAMRQLGAFRSGQMAQKFENTIAEFSGDIREDIAKMTTTIVKNKANVVLLDAEGNTLSEEEKYAKMDTTEANLIRRYNSIYRGMGLMKKSYTAKRSFKWLAENSEFNEAENSIIDNAAEDNPDFSRKDLTAQLIARGLI